MSTSTCILISTHSSTSTTSNSTSTRIIIPLHLTNVSLFEAHIASVNLVVHICDPAQYDVPDIGMLHRNFKTVFVQFWHFLLISYYPLKSYQYYQYEISCDPLLSDYYVLLHCIGETWQIRGTMSFIGPLRILTSRTAFGEIFFAGPKNFFGFSDCLA